MKTTKDKLLANSVGRIDSLFLSSTVDNVLNTGYGNGSFGYICRNYNKPMSLIHHKKVQLWHKTKRKKANKYGVPYLGRRGKDAGLLLGSHNRK